MRTLSLSLLAFACTACSTINEAETIAVSQVSVAKLARADGSSVGVATLSQRRDGLWLNVAVTKLTPGSYGIHLHAVGKCEGPDFATAGPHWNPMSKQHGFDNPMGAHAGDLRNLAVNNEGVGTLDAKVGEGPIATALDADGLAIIIHEKADDYSTDPSGNSGKRVMCGVFGRL